jgi:PAS domain S-box-containing protein
MSEHKLGTQIQDVIPRYSKIERRRWQHWFLVLGTLVVVTFGLAAAVLALLPSRLDHTWAWAGTEHLLIGGFILIVLIFAAYMTRQQRELTGLRRAWGEAHESALHESEARFDQLTANIREVFWVSNVDSPTRNYVSHAYERIWNRSRDDLHENPSEWTDAIHVEDRAWVRRTFAEKASTGEFDEEYRILLPDGSIRWIHDRGFPVRDKRGNIIRVAGIAEDITHEKVLKNQLHHSQRLEAIGQLSGGVAHDFNNLLTVIMGRGQLLLFRLEDEGLRREFELIRRTAKQASSLTRQLLAFSRREVLSPRPADLNEVVNSMEKMLQRLIGEHIELVTDLDSNLDEVKVDAGEVEQIIMNLAINARDAMPGGGKLIIETSNSYLGEEYAQSHSSVKPGSYVRLSVSDTGCGMDAETQSRVFEPFFTTKEVGKGTGLGMAMVYGILKANGGNIWVYSEPDVGTTFKIYIPRLEGARSSDQAAVVSEMVEGSETVLLVEDEETLRAMAEEVLQNCGYTVLSAANGREALSHCEEHTGTIDLLVTDVVMPGMNGGELARCLLELRPTMKVFYMSGYTDNTLLASGVLRSENTILQKPFTPAELSRTVRDVIDGDATKNSEAA